MSHKNSFKIFCLSVYILFALSMGIALTFQQMTTSDLKEIAPAEKVVQDFKPAKSFSSDLITLAYNDSDE